MSRRFARALPNLDDRPGRVLICEDSDELRAMLVSRLAAQHGVEVVGDVSDGAAALEAIADLDPDVLLLDLVMDDGDPEEMLRALAAVEPRPIVIVYSGLAPGVLAPESGATIDLFLNKGTPLPAVAELVAEAITAHRAGERL
jgi:DNA-binding NarL/FixJ family response regulator